MLSPLLVTKLHLPSPRLPLVQRQRLWDKLNQGLSSKLILISAAAGFGKTTLLSEWVHQAQVPVSWLSLDNQDNDIQRFWRYIVAALRENVRDIGAATLAMLQASEAVTFEAFLIPLINELAQLETALILVLDDYHLIQTAAIHDTVTFFIEHLPAQIHLAIATRVDPPLPLARWRVRNQLTQLQADDLRFTDIEAAIFLQQSIPVSLTESQIATLQTKTEGWIAGLQLAMLSLRDRTNPDLCIASFGGDQPYILDYLVEEVLQSQSSSLQLFLLRTSILGQMTGSLCEVVIKEDTVNGAEILEHLERQNLFLTALDANRTWYRYHHLFAESLRHLLLRREPNCIREYHYRAAQWYQRQGYITEAIQHAISAQTFDYAAGLIEQEIQTTENPRIDAIALGNALKELPVSLTTSRPWLLVAKAWAAFTSSSFPDIVVVFKTLENLLNQGININENSDRFWGLVSALKGMQARQQGDTVTSVTFMEKALQLLPVDNSWLRSLILLNLGVTYFVADNYQSAKGLLREVSYIGRVQGRADPAIAGLYLQAQFLALRGKLESATSLCQQGLELATQRHWLATYAGILVQVALADLLREQNQLATAAQHLNQSIERAIENRQPGLMMGYITLARVQQAQGDLKAAWAAIHAAERCQPWLWPTILPVETCKVRLHLAQGNLDAAIAWVENSNLSIEDELHYNTTEHSPVASELNYLTYARVLLAYGQHKSSASHLQDAWRLQTRLHKFAVFGGRTIRVMETLLLQALVLQAQGNRQESLNYLNQALNIPRQGNYIRLFLDEGKPMAELLQQAVSKNLHSPEVNLLLAEFGTVSGLIEPLTEREIEVLNYLATGMSNQAIADRLFVSLAAVKWHARNIYSKLDVNNRTQAVAKARELGILS
ncbi:MULTISPECIES: LuxR C-terminal-related transcriptional regulator [Calothrix]|uniref:LuxR family transcriptional regulator n=2 Tax=Calothrix TaxID=1186 RepID=A0ABR8AND1_9CYAN|nr:MULTISPECIES: LuxR C-terminal-related transcriptional regulator [Calothrix]MBD2200137.1 LuxR family transcriptional regulator [Calothrix parietina FACHB-288]MBD2229110.1 LuxR family transcriptional regulator [Calothrix anomala FACHB-343]